MKQRSQQERKAFKAKEVKAAAKRQNPIRSKMALPDDVDLDEIAWKPTQLERRWARLARLDAQFEQSEKEYRAHRVAVLQQMIEADLKRIRELEGE